VSQPVRDQVGDAVIVEGETVGEWLRLEIDDDTPGVFTVAREGVG